MIEANLNGMSTFDKKDTFSLDSLMVIVFFFFNTLFLPAGLLYTTILTPIFFLSLLLRRRLKALSWYFLITLFYYYYHQSIGADMKIYLRSYILFSSAAIFTIWIYYYLRDHHHKLAFFFKNLTLFNTIMTAIALLVLAIPFINTFFWYFVPIHPAIPVIPRMKLLVYEPSFYSLQLAPVFLYYFLSSLFEKGNQYLTALFLLLLSLVLSLSFGVIGGLIISVLAIFLIHPIQLLRRKKIFFTTIYLSILSVGLVYAIMEYFPYNPIVDRVDKILAGHDSSANGRTWEAFLLAWQTLGETDYFFGAGLGQIKVAAHDIIVSYYNYQGKWTDLVRIPNTMAETLVTFGIVGAVFRILTQVGLFFYTKVYENYYRFTLFLFLFLYQFTGSYLTNVYEYTIWVLVFLPVFPKFRKS